MFLLDGELLAVVLSARMAAAKRVRVLPVTPDRWDDFEQLFGARGAPHYCWCTPYRCSDVRHWSSKQKRAHMHGLVAAGTPIGVLAYAGERAVGWCSVAPRETYVRLQRSRTMPRVSDAPTWTVLCLFVPRPERGQQLTSALLKGALRYARASGAQCVEGYPHDTAGISASHRGSSRAFAAAGFQQQGKRWVRSWSRV